MLDLELYTLILGNRLYKSTVNRPLYKFQSQWLQSFDQANTGDWIGEMRILTRVSFKDTQNCPGSLAKNTFSNNQHPSVSISQEWDMIEWEEKRPLDVC